MIHGLNYHNFSNDCLIHDIRKPFFSFDFFFLFNSAIMIILICISYGLRHLFQWIGFQDSITESKYLCVFITDGPQQWGYITINSSLGENITN